MEIDSSLNSQLNSIENLANDLLTASNLLDVFSIGIRKMIIDRGEQDKTTVVKMVGHIGTFIDGVKRQCENFADSANSFIENQN